MGQSWFSGMISKVLSSLYKYIMSAVSTALLAFVNKAIFALPQKSKNGQNGAKWLELVISIFLVILVAFTFSMAPKAAPKKKEEKKDEQKKDEQKEGDAKDGDT